MESHLGIKCNFAHVSLKSLEMDVAGEIKREDFSQYHIYIKPSDKYGHYNYLAILAHELSHSYQMRKGIEYFDEHKKELFTDALTFYLGFGDIMMDGKKTPGYHSRFDDSGIPKKEADGTLGYLGEENFVYLSKKVSDIFAKRKKAEEEKHEKHHLIIKIKSRFDALDMYISQIKLELDFLKNEPLSSNDLNEIQSIIIFLDDGWIKETKNICLPSSADTIVETRNKFEEIEKRLKKIFLIHQKILQIKDSLQND